MSIITQDVQKHWRAIRPLFVIQTEADYDRAVNRLNRLIDEIGTNEQHPMYELLDTLGTLIHAYEEKHYPLPESSGVEMLRFFMEEHGLSTSDLPEIGSADVVSDVLEGKRELTIAQIRALARRFNISPAVFL
ncbi:MAG: transcriptional regulator [candidate division KSB1 bacterium]|nr:transcriptional regulator [candidate division KSB1 bacterium]